MLEMFLVLLLQMMYLQCIGLNQVCICKNGFRAVPLFQSGSSRNLKQVYTFLPKKNCDLIVWGFRNDWETTVLKAVGVITRGIVHVIAYLLRKSR